MAYMLFNPKFTIDFKCLESKGMNESQSLRPVVSLISLIVESYFRPSKVMS